MEVRRLRLHDSGDIEAYRDVRLRALRLAPYAYLTTLAEAEERDAEALREFTERMAASEEIAGFVLERDGGGFGGLASVRLEPDGAGAEVNQMWVDEDLRGAGWGEELLASCERFAAEAGAQRVTLWVADDNPRAERLYARFGYVRTGSTEPFPRGGTEVEMAKSLSS